MMDVTEFVLSEYAAFCARAYRAEGHIRRGAAMAHGNARYGLSRAAVRPKRAMW